MKSYDLPLIFFIYISEKYFAVNRIICIVISFFSIISAQAQIADSVEKEQYNITPSENSSTDQKRANSNYTSPYQSEDMNERGLVTPQFSANFLHGNVLNANDIEGKNGSNYIQLTATMNTGTQTGSFYNNFKKPQVGITVLGGFLGKKDVLGSTIALYPTWRYTFLERNTIGINLRFGTGLAWFTKPYNKFDNPENLLVGSHLTNATEIGLNLWFRFLPQWKIEAGSSFLHFSNGHTAIPNYGLNDVTARIGVLYEPGTLTGKTTRHRSVPTMDAGWKKSIGVSLGRHELAHSTYPTDGPSYNVYKLSGYMFQRLTPINEVHFGVSVTYYESYYTFIHLTDYYSHFQRIMASVLTLHVGHEFLINRFGFDTDLGIKVLDPFYRSYFLEHDSSLWYKAIFAPRVGVKFYPIWNAYSPQKLALGMYIKTNGVQADYVEYSMSFTF